MPCPQPTARSRIRDGRSRAGRGSPFEHPDLEAGLVVLPIDGEGLDVTPLLRDEVVYVSADPRRITQPVTMADLAAAKLILYDAHYGWRDPTRRQLADVARHPGDHPPRPPHAARTRSRPTARAGRP
uniref:LysR substrate-binding domain-containing protein n=1 Tax=Streptomyces sp. NRRL WC-3744 TaxID=1463935 RepID=UPI0022772724